MTPTKLSLPLFALLSLLLLPAPARLEARSPVPGQGGITGRVSDRDGFPLPGVLVRLEDRTAAFFSESRTDPSGEFHFEATPAPNCRLVLEKAGFRTVVRELALAEGGRVDLSLVLLSLSEAVIRERVMVVGDASAGARLPGSAHYLDHLQEENVPFDDIHQLLRRVPGVNLQEEEGYGLRPNVGIRGTGSERSSNITLMEDGVLIAPAPYAAPAAYYFPVTGRMQAVEVRKGSSQIKYGPRTNGGALNLVSRDIPSGFEVDGNLGLGAHGTGKAQLSAGDSQARFGWLLQTYQVATDGFKELDQGGKTGFQVGDYLAKVRFNSQATASVYQQFELKLGYTSQDSRETYLGLTDEDFRLNPLRRYSASQRDRFDSDHNQVQATYLIAPSDRFDITTTAYRNGFRRNWYKLQSVEGTDLAGVLEDPDRFAGELSILRGADSREDALAVRANNRRYYAQGIQSVAGLRLGEGPFVNLLEFGFRYHHDEEDRFQHEDGFQMLDGRMVRTRLGAPGSQSNRIGDASALALFAQNTIEKGRWALTPGFRFENIHLRRTDYAGTDPERRAPTSIRENEVNVFIPGLGFRFDWRSGLHLFGGLHKGFAPPGPGSAEEVRPEESLNYEGGLRWMGQEAELQAAAFFNDYSNLLGTDTLASGGSGEGDSFNGGRSRVWGFEVAGRVRLASFQPAGIQVPLRFAYTFTRGRFGQDFESDFEPWGSVRAGDQIPYLAPHQVFAGLSLQARRWRLNLDSTVVSRMRTVAGQGPIPHRQSTDGRALLDISGEYDLTPEARRVTLFLAVQNLTDRAYIVARRPAGVRPGLPRTLMGGLRFHLGQ